MENEELKERFIDEKIGIEYIRNGDYYLPNLTIKKKKIVLNKYGRLRLEYLKKQKNILYTTLCLEGKLNKHLQEIQDTATTRITQTIKESKAKSGLTEDMKDTDPLYWIGIMNAIKQQAEEIVYNEIIFQ